MPSQGTPLFYLCTIKQGGKGIALQFKEANPNNYRIYRKAWVYMKESSTSHLELYACIYTMT